jgi:hypothetical protein
MLVVLFTNLASGFALVTDYNIWNFEEAYMAEELR